jgi:hypothetical protein
MKGIFIFQGALLLLMASIGLPASRAFRGSGLSRDHYINKHHRG